SEHDRERHADRGNADDRSLAQHRQQVALARESVGRERGEQRVQDEEREQRSEPGGTKKPTNFGHPVASSKRSCSLSSLAGRAAPSLPRTITAMRSHTPSSSGK